MSEKKFALQTVGDTVVRNNQTNEIYWNYNLVHLINSLSKENEMLRILLKDLYVNDELRKLAEKYGVENE